MELISYLDKGHDLGPAETCFICGDRSWTYGEVVDRSHRIAAAIARDGFVAGTKAAVLSPNDPEAFISILGFLRAHLVWLPINPRYAQEDIIDLLASFDCELLIVHPSFAPMLAALPESTPQIRTILSIKGPVAGAILIDDWIEPPRTRHNPPPAAPEDIAAIISTGGTTGRPKGVMQTHRAFTTYVANHLASMWHDARPRYLVAAPMTHASGYMCFPMLARGGTIVVIEGAQPQIVADAMARYAITDIFLPPTVIYMMLTDPEIRAMRFPSLRYLLYAAAPMSVDKLRNALDWLGPTMVQGFGQVEALMLCTVLRPEDHYVDGNIADDTRLSSCGRPAPFAVLAVMNEKGELLGDDEVGEIVIRSGNVMKGYYKDNAATAEVSRFGWHHTGDLGYRDAQGFYHIVDRARDMIISGGFNIYPLEIEQVLWAHPAVQDCAVIGVPDDKWGEAVTAIVQLKPGHTIDSDTLIGMCKARLGSIKAPKVLHFLPELPRSPVGKVLKRELRDRFWENEKRRI